MHKNIINMYKKLNILIILKKNIKKKRLNEIIIKNKKFLIKNSLNN